MPFPCYLKTGTLFQKSGKLRRVRKHHVCRVFRRKKHVFMRVCLKDWSWPRDKGAGQVERSAPYSVIGFASHFETFAILCLWKIMNCILRRKAHED